MIRRLLWLLGVPILALAQPVLPPQVCSASVTTNCVLVTNTSGNLTIGATVLNGSAANLTSTDQVTPSNPGSGKTAVYTKSGTLCSLDPSGTEHCTGTIPPTLARNLNGPGVAAKCQSAVAAAAFSLPAAAAPSATCESDGIQAYLAWTANTAQTAYDRFDLPVDWTGVLKVIIAAYSTSTNAPTIAVSLSCISTGATASPTFGTAQTISLTPAAASGRTAVSTTLTTDAGHANKACAAGDLVEWKLAITAAAAADLRVLSVRFTE